MVIVIIIIDFKGIDSVGGGIELLLCHFSREEWLEVVCNT